MCCVGCDLRGGTECRNKERERERYALLLFYFNVSYFPGKLFESLLIERERERGEGGEGLERLQFGR